VSFAPNALGQPTQASGYASGASYHPNGQRAGFTYTNGLIHSQTLNARGLPQRIRDRSGAASRLDYTYTYDAHGNVTSILDGVNGNENRSLQYDARDRPISATAANIYGEEIYEYDALDNVRRVAGYPNGLGGYVQDHRYQYDAGQRLSRIDNELGVPQWYVSSSGLGEAPLTRTGHGQTWNYQWNAAGRMTRADRVHAGSTWEAYAYDAHGHRTLSTRNTGSTRHQIYTRAGQLLYTEDSRDNQRIDYIHLGNKLIAQRSRPLNTSTATTTWHHTDAIQSANVETSSAGAQTHRTVRMPFGAPYSGQYREGPGFAGHVTDTQTNLTYMQQRYYDPIAQRFLSPDPVDVSTANGSNFNRYWYANNNPYRFIDPDGRESREFNWENRQLGVTPPPRHPDDWMGPAIGVALGAMLLAVPDPSDVAIAAGFARLTAGLNAGKGFAQARRCIDTIADGLGATGGRSGRRTAEFDGRGGETGASRLFDRLTGGNSEARDGGRLGSLGDGSRVQMSSRITRDGMKETSVRISSDRIGSRIKDVIKVRFKEKVE